MKQAKTVFIAVVVMLICCSYSIGQLSSGIGVKGNVGASPNGMVDSGTHAYPVVKYGASVPMLREFVCNSMSACGMYDPAHVSDGAIVNLGGVSRVMNGTNGTACYHWMPSQSSTTSS
jgi:hypothetical protein